jgi:hypothetical protein
MTRALVSVWLALAGVQTPWTAPDHPDPSAILSEAREDARAGRYEVALAKHEWIQRDSLARQPSFAGVRASFALSAWVELGGSYPPALDSLRRFRDQALGIVIEGRGVHPEFHDFVAINHYLGEEERTRDAFVALDRDRPDVAAKVYELAEPALIEAKDYAVCGRYLKPERRWAVTVQLRSLNRKRPEYAESHLKDFDEKSFTYRSAVVIALLVLNDRGAEARRMADLARAEWDDPSFHSTIAAALEGTLPPRFP